jgi:outer membrane protein TolC
MKRIYFIIVLVFLWGHGVVASHAITLEASLQRAVEKNAEIQKAKAGLEEAAGRRLVFHSVALPNALIGAAAGDIGGHRAGQSPNSPFGFGYGSLTQPLFNARVPASRRRGDVEVLIAKQKLNVAVSEQLHAARLAFYAALFNRSLITLREEQREQLAENAGSQKSRYEAGLTDRNAAVGAELQTRELDPKIETARRAYEGARLKLAEAIGNDIGPDAVLPDAEGELHYTKVDVDLAGATTDALEHRPDLKLARLLVRSADEDQRMIEAAYYPAVILDISGDYIPTTKVRRDSNEGSPKRSDAFVSSEIRAGGAYTWRVIDNGKVYGAVARQRATREVNQLLVHKMEVDVPRDLSRIENDLEAIATKQQSLIAAAAAAEQNASTVRENLAAGVVSQLEYRLAENSLLDARTGLLGLAYQENVALAEWDRALGRYLQFSDDNSRNVQ